MSDNELEEANFKVVLIGESGVGKTSIISQFVDQIFEEDLSTSTGGSFSCKIITLSNGQKIKFEIWDTAGQERYRALTKIFYKNAFACILVFDITNKDSFEQLRNYWIFQIKESAPENIILAIAANKSDLLDKELVDENEARKFAQENNALFFSTSAKNSVGINELFMGIGKKYYGWDDDIQMDKISEKSDAISALNKTGSIKLKNKKERENKKGCC